MSLDRIDLSKHDKGDLEDLKNDLTNSFEKFDDALSEVSHVSLKKLSVREKVNWFNARTSAAAVSKSVPSSPIKNSNFQLPVRNFSVENLSCIEPLNFKMSLSELEPLKKSRAGVKSRVTRIVNNLKKLHGGKTLTLSILAKQESQINGFIDKINEVEQTMADIYDQNSVSCDNKDRSADFDVTATFILDHQTTLAKWEEELTVKVNPVQAVQSQMSKEEFLEVASKLRTNPSSVALNCQEFHGDSNDKHKFASWLAEFNTVVRANPGWESADKLTYLKSKLKGTAKLLIRPIELNAVGFDQAIADLKKRFTNKDYNRDQLFIKITNARPAFCPTYSKTEHFITEVRTWLLDLKNHYNSDLITPGTGGFEYVSHLIFSRLSPELQGAFIQKLNKDYPTFTEIYDNHIEIINNLNRTRRKKVDTKDNNTGAKVKPPHSSDSKPFNQTENFASSASPVIKSGSDRRIYHCRFCKNDGHTSSFCRTYDTLASRQKRCVELSLCGFCTLSTHPSDSCFGKTNQLRYPCKLCKSPAHVAALCDQRKPFLKAEQTNVCLSTNLQNQSNYLLPIVAIQMQGHNGSKVKFNCLLDSASSRSYISKNISDQLGLNKDLVKDVDYQVKTFLGSGCKSLREASLTVFLPSGRFMVTQILIDKSFSMPMNVRGLKEAMSNIEQKGFKLAADYNEPVEGLIGVDIFQFIRELQNVKCMHGSAFKIDSGIIPYGDTGHFLHPGQVPLVPQTFFSELNFKTIVAEVPSPKTSDIKFCLEPKRSYEDPAAAFFPESFVERNIDNATVTSNLESMFSCESIGITEGPDSLSTYDAVKIKEFEKGIDIINGQVFVELPFHEIIEDVPSNHEVSLKILEIVSNKLLAQGKLEAYNQIFFDQVDDGQVEEFHCLPENFKDYIWIPHHGVDKDDPTSTFPVRPVFNCSLKTNKSKPSLNEASYTGVNLTQDMAALIMLFRTNKFSLLGDLKKAFLQIGLKLLKDRNRFCFFLRVGNKLRCFRYKTLIFGYCASPFILNYVLRHLANLSPQDECTEIIRNKFFVDNLATTHNDLDFLTTMYKTCVDRMDKFHFNLRSCNSNSESLRDLMKQDGKFISHGLEWDKVLGYRYNATGDKMQLANVKIDSKANTPRKLLSQAPKVFDPLGLASPVTVRSKSLLSSQWAKRSGVGPFWDKIIDSEDSTIWSKLATDLEGLKTVEFPRYAFSQDQQTDLLVFCDASKRAYGYVAYAKQGVDTNFIFSKCKTAPLQERTLPTLELLSVFIGLQGLKTMLGIFKNCNFRKVYVAVDAQIVLSWILSDIVKNKKVFVANRIKDIKKMKADIFAEFSVEIQFKYVPTAENPADLLTRGLSLESYKQNLDVWLKGPTWIRLPEVKWPTSDLKCLSTDSKNIVMATQVEAVPQVPCIFSVGRYSSFASLLNVASGVIKVCNKLGILKNEKMLSYWGSDNYQQCAKICLLKKVQLECFPKEIQFLQDPRDKPVPELVRNFNLFLDEHQLMRSDCRLGKVLCFDKDIIHPVLLPKMQPLTKVGEVPKIHPLTRLIVIDCHQKVKHLGIQSTLNKVRMSGFRLIKPFQTVKSIIGPCAMCTKFNCLSYKYPHMTNLPKHRVNLVRPFGHVGVDYTGHIIVKEEAFVTEEGKKPKKILIDKKYYLLIFTCLAVRACHVELIPEMSTEHFVLAIVRFCNEYGIPDSIYSDNAKSFISGVNVLEKVFASAEFKERFSTYNIKHVRIPLYSPWIGATWERLIRTIKGCLKKTIGRAKLDYFKLKTVLSDIQLAINCRPLTYRCSKDEGLEVITPNKFLKPNVESNLIMRDPKEVLPNSVSRKALIKSLDLREEMVSHFKDLWYEQYLLSLRALYKNLHETDFTNRIKVNDIVLIKNPAKGRHHWRLGRVIELIFGSDNKVRSAKILKGNDKYRTSEERKLELHSLSHLYPLELSITHDHVVETEISQDMLNREVEDLSTLEPQINQNMGESSLGSGLDVEDLLSTEEVEDINEAENSFRFTQELDPQDLENLNSIGVSPPIEAVPVEEINPDLNLNVQQPSVSARGRIRRPARRLLDDQFVFDQN